MIACCEAVAFVYASALGSRVDISLALIRESRQAPTTHYFRLQVCIGYIIIRIQRFK